MQAGQIVTRSIEIINLNDELKEHTIITYLRQEESTLFASVAPCATSFSV